MFKTQPGEHWALNSRKGKGQAESDLALWSKARLRDTDQHGRLLGVTGRGARACGGRFLLVSTSSQTQSSGQKGHDHDRF
jgi:hypothetical protein